ncbi:baeRF7 domain-containing protein [Pseudochryseolinea flava]|uniref:Uncharacterized protein n=1 Tax=Pseudochryseolinea flava TaxID=2059302 RepID=A0A364XVH7_9BACT|nr:hypothetical protein [Pseudochryseolinea flava]RAV97956.1 hypothetical protein DQQ10_26150 [Pseudochryseolinea flava]
MGKDKEGNFHPMKGKPSGNGKEIDQQLNFATPGAYEKYVDIANKYTGGLAEEVVDVKLRHPNRNVSKRDEKQHEKRSGDVKSKKEVLLPKQVDTEVEEILTLSQDVFTSLAEYVSPRCVTIYLPTHKAGVAVNEQNDLTEFKSRIQQASSKLKANGMSGDLADRIVAPGYKLIANERFWRELTCGLAVFLADGYCKYYKMPVAPKDELLINSSFFLSPLIPIVTQRDYFYLLVLSKKQARFYKGDRFGLTHIPVPEMPNGIEDVVHFEEKDDQKLWRTGSSGAGGGANYHGIGAGKPDDKENIAMYLDEVDETLWKDHLNKENAPLLLAGVEYLVSIYKQVAQYGHIWPESIHGSHEHDDIHALSNAAQLKMHRYFLQRKEKMLDNYGVASGAGLSSSIVDEVIPAAFYSRVSVLFALKNEHLWGKFDEQDNVLALHAEQQEQDECLLDKAVIQTLLHGGEVFLLDKEEMPAHSKLAAILRY